MLRRIKKPWEIGQALFLKTTFKLLLNLGEMVSTLLLAEAAPGFLRK